jgi:hypothetical protein
LHIYWKQQLIEPRQQADITIYREKARPFFALGVTILAPKLSFSALLLQEVSDIQTHSADGTP